MQIILPLFERIEHGPTEENGVNYRMWTSLANETVTRENRYRAMFTTT